MNSIDVFEQLEFWQNLSNSEQGFIKNNSRTEIFPKGNIINRTDEGCRGAIILQSGQIRVYILSDEGREVTLYRLYPSDVCVFFGILLAGFYRVRCDY